MTKFSDKQINNATETLFTFFRVAGYIDEEDNPTDKADGILAVDKDGDLSVIDGEGTERMKEIELRNLKAINAIAQIPDFRKMTTLTIRKILIAHEIKIV